MFLFNPIALRKAKIVYNLGLSECNRVKSRKGQAAIGEITKKTEEEMGRQYQRMYKVLPAARTAENRTI